MSAQLTQEEEINWQAMQNRLAESNGLAIVVADEKSSDLSKSNNNSMCGILYNSREFAPECQKFCGRAFEWATEAGKTVDYKCYAGLNCLAVPVKTETKQLVAIVGRTFLKAEDYRNATTRAVSGDWQKFSPTEFFGNVLFNGSSQNLETTAKQIENLSAKERNALLQSIEVRTVNNLDDEAADKHIGEVIESSEPQTTEIAESFEESEIVAEESSIVAQQISLTNTEKAKEISQWRSLLGSLLDLNYRQACEAILRFITKRYSLSSLAWLERKGNRLEAVFASGSLNAQQMQLSVSADDERLLNAVRRVNPLELHERQTTENARQNSAPQTIRLFPIAVGGEIRSAIVVGDAISSEKTKRHIARFCQIVASQLEILRLREQLLKRSWLERAVQKFNESVRDVETEDFWLSLAQISAELMRAERSSLLVFDEKSNSLALKAATGASADFIEREKGNLGSRIAQKVLQNGKPLLVEDVQKFGISAASTERNYKTNSFISYPIMIEKRKIGVLNVTDRADGESYNEADMEVLNQIMPQLAVSIDRALLRHKAGEFEQLSVTDALTGLLNRLYFDARLPEEIRRSNREGFPMSLIALDVDSFKSYNDNFGHPEGDKALKLVAYCLKDTLRGEDVAARYGGEEFSILLPQTTSDEAAIIGERIREKVASTEFPNRQVTISVGIASCPNTVCTAQEITKWADDALYEAKRQGRNNVQIHEKLLRGEK